MAQRSIASKLTVLGVLSSVTAVVLAGAVFVVYDFASSRESFLSRFQTHAEIIALNSASAVVFNDADAARSTLEAMKAVPPVLAAGIWTQGRLFATYSRSGAPVAVAAVPEDAPAGHRFDGSSLWVYAPVRFENQRLGSLFIHADLHEIHQRLRRYAIVVLVVSGLAVLATFVVSSRAQRGISRPILALAEVARVVSSRRDYSARAPGGESPDEMGLLVRTFNDMLAEIQKQHGELLEARQSLELRVAERTSALAAANKELEAFSYSVSHDLRAPLRAIDGFSKALATSYHSQIDEKGRHYLDRIRSGTQRMSELIDDLLLLARITRADLVRRPVDLGALARSVVTELCRQEPDRKVDLQVGEGMSVQGDSHMLQIVFENLLGNAWKFTRKAAEPRIEVGQADRDGQRAYFVHDNGAGFDMEHAGKLFGAFQRLHAESEYEGTGIGLATVQRIVTRHGGKIWAEAAVGKGATFFFTLGEAA